MIFDDYRSVSKHFFKVATHSSSIFYGIDKCSNTSVGVNASGENTINLLQIYFKN
jgi:hypothetical protein